jgi:hypothetical protein
MKMEERITIKNQVCLTYQANSSVLPYHFIGSTEEDARAQLQEWLNRPRGKAPEAVLEEDGEQSKEIRVGGRGASLVGKVWMGNKETKEKIRVDPSEVGKYLNMGFIKAGPRTQL